MAEADMLLSRYCRLMAPTFPFVLVPAHATAQSLASDHPVMLQAIITVAFYHDYPQQQNLVKQFMKSVGERMFISNEKSLDLLQGILIVTAWYHPHIFNSQQATNMLYMAQALATDLQIGKHPFQCDHFRQAALKHGVASINPARNPNTLNDHRALAGLIYLTSLLGCAFKKVESMKFTKYLDEALTALEQAHEHDSDLLLVQLVRLQHLTDEATKTEATGAPVQMYIKAFSADLAKLRKVDAGKVDNDPLLKLQYLVAEVSILALTLDDLQDDNTKPFRSNLDDICSCVQVIKSFFDVFFTIPTYLYVTLPFSTFAHFAHAFMSLVKLAALEVEGWDMTTLRSDFEFVKVFDELIRRYEESSGLGPDNIPINNDSFVKWGTRIRFMKTIYESKFAKDNGEACENRYEAQDAIWAKPANVEPLPSAQVPTPLRDDMLSGDFFNYLDENFWGSFAGDFDLGFPETAMN